MDIPDERPVDLAAGSHRSRLALERVLGDPADDAAWESLAETYQEMAAEWPDWAASQRWYTASVRAGLRHAKPVPWVLEVSCGTGQATLELTEFADHVVATDVNLAMIERAPRDPRVEYLVCDVRAIPLGDGSVPMLVGLNAVPHIHEFQRIIAKGGQLLWCTSFAAGTPLYVEPERLLRLFGPGWTGEAGRAGHGDWLLLTRE